MELLLSQKLNFTAVLPVTFVYKFPYYWDMPVTKLVDGPSYQGAINTFECTLFRTDVERILTCT